jgi:hypothetical protein
MTLQIAVEVILAFGAAFLLMRDLRRAWRDPLRRPVTLLMASLVAVLLIGVLGGQSHPSPWWLLVPGAVLVWEVVRGWRIVPRCHLREAGIGTFAVGLMLAALGLGTYEGKIASLLLAAAAVLGAAAIGLFWLSRRREPVPWRGSDFSHYEPRATQRPEHR